MQTASGRFSLRVVECLRTAFRSRPLLQSCCPMGAGGNLSQQLSNSRLSFQSPMNANTPWVSSSPRNRRQRLFVAGLILVLLAAPAAAQSPQRLHFEGFENGWNGWTNDTTYNTDKRFAWVVGTPTNGPATAHTGTNCALTAGPGTDCYLVSPPLALPLVDQYSNHVWLFYWQWQNYFHTPTNICLSDVKVRQWIPGPVGGYWGPWNVIDPGTSGVIPQYSPVWRRRGIDLTLFSGGVVQLGFGHYGAGDPGWCVDDVEIWDVPVLTNWPGVVGFESACEAWHTDEGVWDIGVPTGGGPTNVPGGLRCAGTALDGAVPTVFESHLWTPAFYLPAVNPVERVYLQFEQWYDYPNSFCAAIQWSQWWSSIGWSWPQIIDADLLIVSTQRQWLTVTKDITRLAGLPLPMRLGFEHSNVSSNGLGWFIDNVRINVAHFRIASLDREGNDLRVTWSSPAGMTNVLQCSPSLTGNFTNVSPALVATGAAESITTYLHTGAANTSPRFYRIRRMP